VEAVDLVLPAFACGGGDGELELGHPLEQNALDRAFAGARGPGDDDDR
jgi:hypothetical protein